MASPAVLEQAEAQGRAEMERELAQYKALGSQGQRAAGAGATSSLPKLKKADTGVAKQMADLKAAEQEAAARGDYDGARDLQNQYKALESQGVAKQMDDIKVAERAAAARGDYNAAMHLQNQCKALESQGVAKQIDDIKVCMYVHTYVCMYVCVCVTLCVCVYLYIYLCMYLCIDVSM